jgi:hypothetical protein
LVLKAIIALKSTEFKYIMTNQTCIETSPQHNETPISRLKKSTINSICKKKKEGRSIKRGWWPSFSLFLSLDSSTLQRLEIMKDQRPLFQDEILSKDCNHKRLTVTMEEDFR